MMRVLLVIILLGSASAIGDEMQSLTSTEKHKRVLDSLSAEELAEIERLKSQFVQANAAQISKQNETSLLQKGESKLRGYALEPLVIVAAKDDNDGVIVVEQ